MTTTSSNSYETTEFHVQTTADTLRDGFPYFDHHDSVSKLWTRKWRPPCDMGAYPFFDGAVADFDPIFAELTDISGDDTAILYDPDRYAAPFISRAERLSTQAEAAVSAGNMSLARDMYLRAAAIYRISRFPVIRSAMGQQAWEKGKAAYEQGGALLDPPSVPIEIPFTQADATAGDADEPIQAYLRLPTGAHPASGWPVMLFMTGLDAYRTDNTPRTQEHVDRGFATFIFEIPGTGDCPAAANDPKSPDRMFTSILDWIDENAATYRFDTSKVCARGISTGGYNAFRLSYTHADRMFAVVSQGGGAHHMFDEAWIRHQDQMEYPYALAEALAYKFGFREADAKSSVDRYIAEGRKFSLIEGGLLGTPKCQLLAINGMEDSIFPTEDYLLIATDGNTTDLLLRGNRPHMGNPGGEEILYAWLDDRIADRP